MDPILRMNQNGFRKGRSTIAQILTLRRIIEEMNRHNKVVVICFVDFKKAFDSINREAWTLTLKQQQRLDGTYTNLLRRVQNIHWSSHATLREIYRELPPISARLAKRRLLFAGHCCRAEGEAVSRLLLWSPSHLPVRSRRLTFPKVISRDAGLDVEDLRATMCDSEVWRDVVRGISAEAEG